MEYLDYDRQKFGKAVRDFRGETPAPLFAAKVNTTAAILSRVERGKMVDAPVIRKLCKLMNVSLDAFPSGRAGEERGQQ